MSDRYPHRAKKRFGQHFLNDSQILDTIVAAINPQSDQYFVEIGPGPGVLTAPLADQVKQLHLIEIDRDWSAVLNERYAKHSHITLHNCDALTFDWLSLATWSDKWRVVGNLPYNISTPLLFSLFTAMDHIVDMHFVLQKEVVDRLTAAVGSRNYGRLSVMAQYYCKTQSLLAIGPEAFSPPPKVNSALIRLIPITSPSVVANDIRILELIVREAFTFRRKTLSNALKNFFSTSSLQDLNIDPKTRPQCVTVDEYTRLANSLDKSCLSE